MNIQYIMMVEVVFDVTKIIQIAKAYEIIPFSKCIRANRVLWCLMAIAHAQGKKA